LIILSICIPTYNRSNQLDDLLSSIPNLSSIEVVICDDGSTDNTLKLIDLYRDKLNINYFFQHNQGVSAAIKSAYTRARGEFLIKMDSDDSFTPGGCENILSMLSQNSYLYTSFVFGVVAIKSDGEQQINIPGKGKSNFIAIRADRRIVGDLKEVVKRSVVLEYIYDVKPGVRRIPPGLLWVKIAEEHCCLCVPEVVAIKTYLDNGITDQILLLKTKFPESMVYLYEILSCSKRYKSTVYRWRYRLLWGRYAFHARSINLRAWWRLLILFPALLIYLVDIYKLSKYSSK
jgi:glycosyltransferase involved in cell wall biosynthesis